ncbi:MAG: rhodanese-like domain-containing protein [Ignavibacteriaceae bacterium]
METYQIVLLALAGLIILLRVKNKFAARSLNNYSADEVKQMIKENKNIILLDVRTERERKAGSIKGSAHVPLHEISLKTDQLKKYQSREIICYCQSGNRSVSAAVKLKKLGYNSANMVGGISGW